MRFEAGHGVSRARRFEAAHVSEERRDEPLVEADRSEQKAEQQAQGQITKSRETFNKAFSACMDGRGYSVK